MIEGLNAWLGATPQGPLVLEIVLKSTVLLGLGFGMGWLLKRSTASVRSSVWAASIVGLLVLPIVVTGDMRWPVLPALGETSSSPAASVTEVSDGPVGARSSETTAPAPTITYKAESPGPRADTEAGSSSAASSSRAERITLPLSPGMVWFGGVLAVLAQLGLGLAVLARWTRGATHLTAGRERECLDRALARADVRRPVQLWRSSRATTPMTWGLRSRHIVLPTESSEWSDTRLALVLEHEVAHVVRGDTIMLAVARFAVALHWFNPLAWAAERRLRAEAERAADDFVLANGARASEYASHLVEIASSLRSRPALSGAAFMADRKGFEGRVLAILDDGLRRRARRGTSIALAAIVLAGVFPLAAAVPAGADAELNDPVRSDGTIESVLTTPVEVVDLAEAEKTAPVSGSPIAAPVENASPIAPGSEIAPPVEAAQEAALDPRSVAALSRALRTDTSVEVRRTAAWALGQIEDAEGVPALLYALANDDDVEVRRTTVWALGQIESPEAVDGLAGVLDDADDETRSQAAWALGQIEAPEAVPALTRLLQDPSAPVRSQAAWALGQIEVASAVDGLVGALDDEVAAVRSQAAWALGQIESRDAVEGLARAVANDEQAAVRSQAAWALGQIEPSTAPQALIDALDDESQAVRGQAAWALAQIEDPATVGPLVDMLTSGSNEARLSALRALASIRTQAAIEAIAPLLQDEDERVRAAAARALGGRSWNSPQPRPQPRPRPRPRSGE